MVDAEAAPGVELEALLARFLGRPDVAYPHAHNARRGCCRCTRRSAAARRGHSQHVAAASTGGEVRQYRLEVFQPGQRPRGQRLRHGVRLGGKLIRGKRRRKEGSLAVQQSTSGGEPARAPADAVYAGARLRPRARPRRGRRCRSGGSARSQLVPPSGNRRPQARNHSAAASGALGGRRKACPQIAPRSGSMT
jgi:hypothetical protein